MDKREPNEKMQGLPLARTQSGSWVLTLYRRPSGVPFVHALMLNSLFAFCIDLPASARVGASGLASWGVATQGTKLFVANAGSGWVGVVSSRTSACSTARRSAHSRVSGTVTRPLAASPDGTRLFLARPHGLVSLDASTLVPSEPLSRNAFDALALGAGGSVLYGAGGGSTQALDPVTGASDGSPQATGKLTLVGVVKAG